MTTATAPQLEIHPICACLPAMDDESFAELKESIEQNGQRKPIITIGNQIIAGRHRYRACLELGRPPAVREYDPERDGPQPALFVIDEDLRRRHLAPGQRAAVFANLSQHLEETVDDEEDTVQDPADDEAEIDWTCNHCGTGNVDADELCHSCHFERGSTPEGEPDDDLEIKPKTGKGKGTANEEDGVGSANAQSKLEKEAQAAGVSASTLQKAKQVLKARPDLIAKVIEGKMSLDEAKKTMKAEDPAAEQKRSDAADIFAEELGDEFAGAVRDRTLLKEPRELDAFLTCSVALRANIQELVEKGWKVNDAVKYHKGLYLQDDTIADLILRYNALGKARSVIVVDGFEIAVKKAPAGKK